jgi:glycosyltransferase involved in cell wall biosynthesis
MDTATIATAPTMPDTTSQSNLRVAWVFPSLELGNYWHPVFSRFSQRFPNTKIFTGVWKGFAPGFEDQFEVETVGEAKFVATQTQLGSYTPNIAFVSPAILTRLQAFRPDVIFVSGFSLWTLLALVGKLTNRWRVIIMYEGCSKTFDYRDSPWRLKLRRLMARFADAFITNSQAGQDYLTEFLQAPRSRVFARPYEVPDAGALLGKEVTETKVAPTQRPHFLFTGQLIPRKGVHQLIEACCLLKEWGYENYSVTIVGDGAEREDLEQLCRNRKLDMIHWAGWVAYDQLGAYFQAADVFVLPTLEDTWGMVILESMVFGKAVICSDTAGAAELVTNGENGYVVNANDPEQLAERFRLLIDQPDLVTKMGLRSQQKIAPHTPTAAIEFLTTVIQSVTGK